MQIFQKDITTVTEGVIAHQVNCLGAMKSGVAKAISEKYPKVYSEYIKFCGSVYYESLLGNFQEVVINDKLTVLNCFSQLTYGRDKKRYTDYDAVDKVFSEYAKKCSVQLYLPYLYGCGLGGGDWDIVSGIVCKHFPEVIFCKV